MNFPFCFLVVIGLAFISCDAQFGGIGNFKEGQGSDEADSFDGKDGIESTKGSEGFGDMGEKSISDNAPMIPTEKEKEMCETEAQKKNTELRRTFKVPKRTCEIMCDMKNGKMSVLMSPKDTKCCDIGGAAATGKCNGNGTCNHFMT